MSPIEAALIRRKLGSIVEALRALEPLEKLPLDEYRKRLYERKAAERLLQEAIEGALDINAHVIAERGRAVPDDYYGGFIALASLGVISEPLAKELAPSAGLRNRLVHEYDAIDDAKVLASISTMLRLYRQYIAAIDEFLTHSGS